MKPARPLVWTARRPRKDGWYFVRFASGLVAVLDLRAGGPLPNDAVAYAGPLVPPEV